MLRTRFDSSVSYAYDWEGGDRGRPIPLSFPGGGGVARIMWQAVLSTASRFLKDMNRTWLREQAAVDRPRPERRPVNGVPLPLRRVTLTDEVSRTLFEGYAAHRRSTRGEEETGWVLLGHREGDEAIVQATLPAGMDCSAGASHVLFNSAAQAAASRIVRQSDRRLRMLGVV